MCSLIKWDSMNLFALNVCGNPGNQNISGNIPNDSGTCCNKWSLSYSNSIDDTRPNTQFTMRFDDCVTCYVHAWVNLDEITKFTMVSDARVATYDYAIPNRAIRWYGHIWMNPSGMSNCRRLCDGSAWTDERLNFVNSEMWNMLFKMPFFLFDVFDILQLPVFQHTWRVAMYLTYLTKKRHPQCESKYQVFLKLKLQAWIFMLIGIR